MFKIITLLTVLVLSMSAWAASTRTVDADGFISSDHTKSFPLPATAGTLLHGNGIAGGTNLKITYNSDGLVTSSSTASITDLVDVSLSSPTSGDILKFNGANWFNGPNVANANASAGVNFFLDDTTIIATGTNNANQINTLLKKPNTITQVVDAIATSSNTVLGEAYLFNSAIGGSAIDGGEWNFNIYCSVSSTAGGRVSSITSNIYRIPVGTGTITTTGSGTSRTATASTGTPFVSGDANASITASGYLQTPQGLYQITAFTSATVVTISVPSTYANETAASYSIWKNLFGVNTGTISTTGTNYSLVSIKSAQTSFASNATDKLGSIFFATSNNTTTVNWVHNGMLDYTFISSPLLVRHNDLANLQGGTTNQYYHLTSGQFTLATQNSSGSQTGLLSSTDWTTFNGKQTSFTRTQEIPSGSGTSFTLAHAPTSNAAVKLYIDGLFLFQGASYDYTISGTAITLNTALATGQTIYAEYSY